MVDYSRSYAALRRQMYVVEKGMSYNLHPNSIARLADYLSDYAEDMSDTDSRKLIDLYLEGVTEATRRFEIFLNAPEGTMAEAEAKSDLDEYTQGFSDTMDEFLSGVREDGRVIIMFGDFSRTH